MACMNHDCVLCGFSWADNMLSSHCPECGGRATNDFDEDPLDFDDDYRGYRCLEDDNEPFDGDRDF